MVAAWTHHRLRAHFHSHDRRFCESSCQWEKRAPDFRRRLEESACARCGRAQREITFVVDVLNSPAWGAFLHDIIDDSKERLGFERFGYIISRAENKQPLDLTRRGI